jgi:hypothetical protein
MDFADLNVSSKIQPHETVQFVVKLLTSILHLTINVFSTYPHPCILKDRAKALLLLFWQL